jgi:hypothetical protein
MALVVGFDQSEQFVCCCVCHRVQACLSVCMCSSGLGVKARETCIIICLTLHSVLYCGSGTPQLFAFQLECGDQLLSKTTCMFLHNSVMKLLSFFFIVPWGIAVIMA